MMVIKRSRNRWTWHAARIGAGADAYKILLGIYRR